MPLSKPAQRKHIHHRNISMHAYEREDGLWDIEAHLIDTKSYSFDSSFRDGYISAGEPLHEMWLRLSIDRQKLIHDAEAAIDASPFPICPQIAEKYKKLIGMKVGPGWNKKTRELFSGVEGCTHLLELLGPMATVAYQAMIKSDNNQKQVVIDKKFINSCHGWSESGEVVKRLSPEFYKAK